MLVTPYQMKVGDPLNTHILILTLLHVLTDNRLFFQQLLNLVKTQEWRELSSSSEMSFL